MFLPVKADEAKGDVTQVTNRMRFAGGDHVVAWLILLEHPSPRLTYLWRVAPVAFGVQVAHLGVFMLALKGRRECTADLARGQLVPPPWDDSCLQRDAVVRGGSPYACWYSTVM